MKNEVREKIKRYKELKADIIDIDIRLEELEEEIIGISALPQGERVSQTYKITSSVEEQAEKHIIKQKKLLELKSRKQREVVRIDNALSILNDDERDIIEMAIIQQKKYRLLEIKYNIGYSRIKQIEGKALKKINKYLI